MPEEVVELALLTWQESEAVLQRGPVGLLPIGATEAHGPHLPLNTDVIIAREMARRGGGLLAKDGIPVVILPAISYGVSFVGTCFGGTSPAGAEEFKSYLSTVLRHLSGQGYRALCICNAHLEPAHVDAIQRAAASTSDISGIQIVAPDKREDRWATRLSEEFRRGARHAGSYETSLLLAASPWLVRSDLAALLPPVWVDLPARLREGARTFADAGGTLGYFGDPARASAEEGERLFDALASIIRDAIAEVLN